MRTEKHPLCRWVIGLAAAGVLLPLLVLAVWCFTERWAWPDLLPQVLSLRGLGEVLQDQGLLILHSSILLSAAAAVLAVAVGILTARAVIYYRFPGRDLLLFSSMLPLIVPTTVFGMGVHLLLIRAGLSDTVAGVLLVHVICALPYTVSLMTDSTRAVGKKLEEQARVLGASGLRAFWLITMPALLPAALAASAMAYIVSFSQYFLTLLIGGGNVRTFTVIMVPYLQNGDRTLAAGYSMLFLVVTLLVFILFRRILQVIYPQAKSPRGGAERRKGS